jgi:hypothetical protein
MSAKPPERSDSPVAPVASATSWNSLRTWGQVLSKTLLASLPPEELRRLRGPCLSRSARDLKRHPLFDSETPLRVLLAPDLSSQDPVVQDIVGLARREGVEVYSHVSTAPSFESTDVRPFELFKRDDVFTVRWLRGDAERESVVLRAEDATFLAEALLGRTPDAAAAQAWSGTAAWAWNGNSEIDMTITRETHAIWERTTNSGFAEKSVLSPEEARLGILAVMHHHGRYTANVTASFQRLAETFGWYSGVAQQAMPWYLPIFASVVKEREAIGEQLGSSAPDLLLDCLQGIFMRVRQLMKIHDQLMWLSLVESVADAKNDRVDEQGDLVFSAVNAVNGALDGLVIWLVEREGIDAGSSKKSVGFPALHAKDKKGWVSRFSRYAAAVAVLERPVHPILKVASDLRVQGYHYHPLLTTTLQFSEFVQVTLADGTTDWRVIREASAGAIRLGSSAAADLDLPYGEDGFLPFSHDAYALPLGFVRGLIRDFLQLLNAALKEIAQADGLSPSQSNEYLGPRSPYANACLDFELRLSL